MSNFVTHFYKMLDTLITSRTRIKLLLRFFLNSNVTAYLRGLAEEFNESTNAIRVELNRFEKSGLLDTFTEGNKKMFKANQNHPLFPEIKNILLKHVGVDKIINNIIEKLGNVEKVYITGNFAKGLDDRIIDLIILGRGINFNYLVGLSEKVERMINRKIRYLVFDSDEFVEYIEKNKDEGFLLIFGEE